MPQRAHELVQLELERDKMVFVIAFLEFVAQALLSLLAALGHHEVDGSHHLRIGEVGPAALRRHEPGCSLETFQGVLVQGVSALCDTRFPGAGIAEFWRTCYAAAVTGHTRCVVNLLTVERFGNPNWRHQPALRTGMAAGTLGSSPPPPADR
jgi:hypothetical protein